jgi:hypothetical protein
MAYDALRAELLATARSMPRKHRVGETLVGRLGTVDALLALLGQIEGDEAWIEQVAVSSYRHALGFDKFVLIPAWPDAQLRMHVWWPGDARVAEHVHDHRYSFASAVVAGRLRNNVFAVGDSGLAVGDYRRYAEDGAIVTQQWQFSYQGEERAGLSLSAEMSPGSTYSMHAGVLHRVEVSRALTVTLLVETSAVKQSSSVLVGQGRPQPSLTPQTRFDEATLRQRLKRLVAEFGKLI